MREIDRIYDDHKNLLALLVRSQFSKPGVTFFTDPELSQQLAYMNHPAGTEIEPHIHVPVSRNVFYTQETLIIKRGSLAAFIYDDQRNYITSRIVRAGDVLLLVRGGHGFEALEDLEMIEVKQGPYTGDRDKVRFSELAMPA